MDMAFLSFLNFNTFAKNGTPTEADAEESPDVSRLHVCALRPQVTCSYLKVVPEEVLRQPVEDLVVATEHLAALSSEARRVDHACSQVARQDVVPANM